MLDFCEELSGVWSWGTDIPFSDIIEYLKSSENNKSKNLKLVHIASNFYHSCYSFCHYLDEMYLVLLYCVACQFLEKWGYVYKSSGFIGRSILFS